MINRLLSDIKNYIEYLEENKIYVSIHTHFTEYMLPLLEYNIHRNPVCLIVKSDNAAWDRCIKFHGTEISDKEDAQLRTCHAGVEEAVFFLACGGTVCMSSAKKIDKAGLNTLANPLCRMIEYLNLLCPDNEFEVTSNEIVNRAIKFIQRNFYNPISNHDIAKACSCSVSTVCHLFKQFRGISVHKYITDLRLSYAKELLKTSSSSITSIAQKSGFSDYNYFSIRFKKEFGMAPSLYRKNGAAAPWR